jgi:hypothetical protein
MMRSLFDEGLESPNRPHEQWRRDRSHIDHTATYDRDKKPVPEPTLKRDLRDGFGYPINQKQSKEVVPK